MKQNNALIKSLGRTGLVLLVAGLAVLAAGCQTATLKVSSNAKIENASGKKVPLSIGLMLEDRFCTNAFTMQSGGRIYPYGPVLKEQTISLCEQSFAKVTVSTDGVVPAGVDATLTPEMHRCRMGVSGGDWM